MGANWLFYEPFERGDLVLESGGHTPADRWHQHPALEEQIAHPPAGGGAHG